MVGERGVENRMQSWIGEYAWIGKKRKGQDSKNEGAGGAGLLVEERLFGIL